MTNTCPHCGRAIVIDVRKTDSAYGVPWTPMRSMGDSARRFGETVETAPEFTEAFRDTPARAPSVEADWSVPARRAATTGILFGVPVAVGVGIKTTSINLGNDILWGLVIIGGCVAASWVFFLSISDSTLWIREKIINRDLDSDGQIGIRVEAHLHREDDEEEHWDLARLPAPSFELLQEFAKDVLNDDTQITFSERGAARYGYSQEMFRDLRDRFVGAGWASWRNPRVHEQGVALLVGGKAILRKIASGDVK